MNTAIEQIRAGIADGYDDPAINGHGGCTASERCGSCVGCEADAALAKVEHAIECMRVYVKEDTLEMWRKKLRTSDPWIGAFAKKEWRELISALVDLEGPIEKSQQVVGAEARAEFANG
jgi:hypothetical protein